MVVGASQESIFVRLELKAKGFIRGIANTNARMQNLNKSINAQGKRFSELSKNQKMAMANTKMNRISQQGFFQTMRLGMEDFKQFNTQGRRFATFGGRIANSFRKGTHGLRGFRMEMLGVMFFGMMLQRVFSGLLRTSLEWMGVMEVFSLALGILFLPIAELILNWAIKFLDIVMGLSENQKKWIGYLVLAGIALGGLLFIIGTFALGLGSIVLAFGAFGTAIATAAIIITGLGAAFIGIWIIIKNWGTNITNVLKGVGFVLMGIGAILILFIGWWAAIPIAIGAAIALIAAKWDTLPSIIKTPLEAIWKFIKLFLIDPIMKAIGLISTLGNILKGFKGGDSSGIIGPTSIGSILRKSLLGFQHGGIVPGNLGSPVPIMAHAGERIIPANKSGGGGVIINAEYNVVVSDKREFEEMLKSNNDKLAEDVRRIVQTR